MFTLVNMHKNKGDLTDVLVQNRENMDFVVI
jgi:hypothetical protein